MDPIVKVGKVRTRTEITGEGQFRDYYDVEFFIDDARHHLAMDIEGFTAKGAEDAVRDKARELTGAEGKQVKV